MTLDLSFLQVGLGAPTGRTRPVNVYDILREGWRETRVDMTLQFFLDPNERHGLGTLCIDALLRTLDQAVFIASDGKTDETFVAEDFSGSDSWEVESQVNFIDIYARNSERGVAIVLENKISHELNNPLNQYAAHALKDQGVDKVLVAVLAPDRRTPQASQEPWLSRSITYAEFNDQIKTSPELVEHLLSPSDRNQRRSLDLLQQFMEARSGDANVTDLDAEAAQLNEWRSLAQEHSEAIKEFLDARRRSHRIIRDRNKRLEPLIAASLDEAQLEIDWEAHGGNQREVWNAYHFPSVDWSIELKLSTDPANSSIFVYDYQGRTYRQSTIEPLNVQWSTPDQEVADAFMQRLEQILDQIRAGTRGAENPA